MTKLKGQTIWKSVGIIILIALTMVIYGRVERAYAEDYNLWIGGTEVTSENNHDKGWNYDATHNTLTLNGYSYSGPGYSFAIGSNDPTNLNSAFYYNGDHPLEIVLKGVNTFNVTKASNTTGNYSGFYIGSEPNNTVFLQVMAL